MSTYLRDVDFVVRQPPVKTKLRVLACQFCGTETPPPTADEEAQIDARLIPAFNRMRFVTPMEHYWPEGWRILTDDPAPLGNFDQFSASLVCPACVARLSSAPVPAPLKKTVTLKANSLNNEILVYCPGECFDRCVVHACTPAMNQSRRAGRTTNLEQTLDWHGLRASVTQDLCELFERLGFTVVVEELT